MNDATTSTKAIYVTGADVASTWQRLTGWVPPSKDPRYIKKWLDFQLDFIEARREAITSQFQVRQEG
jgi:hypothetical protein